ncbi:PilZ domain-containing protein [Marinicrinis lubricantis]|uniref:PilZ domain-containing protein n=1 Tax=Marinicrinis lubricantis TaxID=2086470 RepID=A0ABW1IKA4_9BACL
MSLSTVSPMRSSSSTASSGILLDSRTVLETKDFVTSGMLTYAEGDIVEIELSDSNKFELGQPVKLSIYSLGGIYTFTSSVVAIDIDVIVALIPPETQKKFLNRREHPRVKVKEQGLIKAHDKREPKTELEPLNIDIQDISLGGVGFMLPASEPGLSGKRLQLELTTGLEVQFEVEVVRHTAKDGGMFYGCKICSFPQDKITSFQAFILTRQIHIRSEQRKQMAKARLQQGLPAKA